METAKPLSRLPERKKQSQLRMSVTKTWTDRSSTHTWVVKLEAADEQTTSSSVMLTAGLKLTSSVDPERDPAVGLRQMRKLYLYSKRRWGASSDAGAAAEISATLQCDINAVRKVNINRGALAAGRCAMDTAMFRYHCWRSAQSTRMTDACRANRAFSHWTNFWSRVCLFCFFFFFFFLLLLLLLLLFFFFYLTAEGDKRICLHRSHVVKPLSKTNTHTCLTRLYILWHIFLLIILSCVNISAPQQ